MTTFSTTLGEYGTHDGFGPAYRVGIPHNTDPMVSQQIRELWNALDDCDCVTIEDDIFDQLAELGALQDA